MQKLLVARTAPTAKLPARQHDTDAGYDLAALNSRLIPSGGRALVRTGIAVAIPEGYVGYINPRSGAAWDHGVTVTNAPGTIDAGYRGELKVNLINLGRYPVQIAAGERIAQLLIHPVKTPELEVTQFDLLPITDRGENGHGSTGRGDTDNPEKTFEDALRLSLIDRLNRGLSKNLGGRK